MYRLHVSFYTCNNTAIPFCSFSGMGGTPPSVSGRQPNSYARGRSTATTSTHQVSYLVNTKLINYLTVFLLSSVLQLMSLSLVSCFIDICYNSILVIKGLFCFICHFHHLFAKICFTVWFCTLCLFLFAMDMYSFNVVLLIITRCWCTTNLKCEGTLDFG